MSLADLCALLRSEGFHFVALTEHTQGISADQYAEFVEQCRAHSGEAFLVIPGLEFRCGDGVEIAGLGVTRQLPDQPAVKMTAAIREAGGFALWVHPFKNGSWTAPFLDCDAVEVLNGKIDGVLAPNLALLRAYREQRTAGKKFLATFGVDLHNEIQSRRAWLECEAVELSETAILRSLREGRFVNRVNHGAMSSAGEIGAWDYCTMVFLRAAYVIWRGILRAVPSWLRNVLVTVSRPFVRTLKR